MNDPNIYAKIIKDSLSPSKIRLTTMEVKFPRIILAEFNTHRVFSRNVSSSRAMPVSKMMREALREPFYFREWFKNDKGMQPKETLNPELAEQASKISEDLWRAVRENVTRLMDLNVHKQQANRYIEPFSYVTAIVSSTSWSNFFNLRSRLKNPNTGAQEEMVQLADKMYTSFVSSKPTDVDYGEWHIPYDDFGFNDFVANGSTGENITEATFCEQDPALNVCGVRISKKLLASAGRCARVSYLNHEGVRDVNADIKLAINLIENGHMSPLEHIAKPHRGENRQEGNFFGWKQLRKFIPFENDILGAPR